MHETAAHGPLILAGGAALFFALLFSFRALGTRLDHRRHSADDADSSVWSHREALTLVQINELTPDIRSFTFQRQNKKHFSPFKAGQFISFQIGNSSTSPVVKTRSYSISSSPHDLSRISVTIKKIPKGEGSTWFHSLKAGDTVIAYPPSGHFVDELPTQLQRLYIAGGIGLTPLMSMMFDHVARAFRESKENTPVALFYGARTQADLAYHNELTAIAKKHSWFRYFNILSHEKAINPESQYSGDVGFLNLNFIKSKIKIEADAHFFMCGPPPMTDALIADLLAAGVNQERIHFEKFVSPIEFDPSKVPLRRAQITFQGQQYSYESKQTILEFLEEKGEFISSACRVGVCGTCRCAGKGQVTMLTDAGLTIEQKQRGDWLACVAYPLENIEITESS